MDPLVVGGAAVLVVLLVLARARGGAGASQSETAYEVNQAVNRAWKREQSAAERNLTGSLEAGAAGLAVAGPAGLFIAAGVWSVGTAIYEAINHREFGEVVRAELKKALRAKGWAGTSSQVDATLVRDFLLSQGQVAQHDDGRLGLIVTRKTGTRGQKRYVGHGVPMSNADKLIGNAATHLGDQIQWHVGDPDLDPAGARMRERDEFTAYLDTAQAGDIHELRVYPGDSQQKLGWAYTLRHHLRITLERQNPRGWHTRTVTTANLDELMVRMDQALGATWEKR